MARSNRLFVGVSPEGVEVGTVWCSACIFDNDGGRMTEKMKRYAWALVALYMTFMFASEKIRADDYAHMATRYEFHFEQCQSQMAEFHRISQGWNR